MHELVFQKVKTIEIVFLIYVTVNMYLPTHHSRTSYIEIFEEYSYIITVQKQ